MTKDLPQHATTRGKDAIEIAKRLKTLTSGLHLVSPGGKMKKPVCFLASEDETQVFLALLARRGDKECVYGRYAHFYRVSGTLESEIEIALEAGPSMTIGPYFGEGWMTNMVWDSHAALMALANCYE